ncbi:ABCG14, partial [Symbiodinium sp. KB8]
MDTDTARECLEFSAYLRLSRNVSKAKRDQLVDKLLADLHLEDSPVIVGGPLKKGLSGGQQKRVAVGVELISNPQMLFLDEPLSGLDSYNAFTLMHTLNRLALTGVPVVMTLHQPSSEIYDLIDDVIFLFKGEVVYQGPRTNLVNHFNQLGFHCPQNHNPADYVMFLIQKESQEVVSGIISSLDSDESSDEESSTDDDNVTQGKVFGQPRKRRNCCQAQWALIKRDCRRTWRERKAILSANIQCLLVSLVYGWLFLGAGKQEYRDLGFFADAGQQNVNHGPPCNDDVLLSSPASRDQCVRSFQVHWGALSIITINAMMASITWAITVFQNERSCFLREASGGYYTRFAYFTSKTIFEFPVVGFTNIVSILTVKWLMGLRANPVILIL